MKTKDLHVGMAVEMRDGSPAIVAATKLDRGAVPENRPGEHDAAAVQAWTWNWAVANGDVLVLRHGSRLQDRVWTQAVRPNAILRPWAEKVAAAERQAAANAERRAQEQAAAEGRRGRYEFTYGSVIRGAEAAGFEVIGGLPPFELTNTMTGERGVFPQFEVVTTEKRLMQIVITLMAKRGRMLDGERRVLDAICDELGWSGSVARMVAVRFGGEAARDDRRVVRLVGDGALQTLVWFAAEASAADLLFPDEVDA